MTHEGLDTRRTKTLPTPVVLAISSLMISIGIGAFFFARSGNDHARTETRAPEPLRARRDLSSPTKVAETFLDGWRKRDHDTTLALSIEQAHVDAIGRRDAEAALDDESRAVQRELWPRMANTRLRVDVERTTSRGPGRTYLEGKAVGTFLDKPYVRRVAFEVVQTPDGLRIARMDLGTIERGAEIVSQGDEGEDSRREPSQ